MQIVYTRPSVVSKYAKQVAFIDAPERYTIVEATTKAGKTTGCIVWLFEQALLPTEGLVSKDGCNYWWVAPIYSQAKIAFTRMKRFISNPNIFTRNETELSITLLNGAKLWFKSGDNPDSLYGEDVYGVVIDEATRMKENSWFAIRSTLTATRGKVKIIGNVKGTGNWVYKLAREAEVGKQNWKYFKLTAADAVEAGVLAQEEIDDARATYPTGVFLELYYAIPFVNSSNKFAYSFDKTKHVAKCSINYDYPVYLSFDFNRNPICCTIIQVVEGRIKVPHVVKLENSNIYNLCSKLNTMLVNPTINKAPQIIINGDASGRAGSAMVKDNLNYFRIIKAEMNIPLQRMQQLASNPKIEENQVLVNAVLEHMPVDIDPDNAQPLIFDLEFVEMLPDGSIKKTDREDPAQQADAIDTFRYFLNRNFKHFNKGRK